jgi:sterol desaturase/sphingolipid hydroxylase (fatty acid hydroxylase superfamily)
VGAAALAAERDLGLLQQVGWPRPLVFAVAVVALDLAVYLQHVAFHALPALWRLHLVHHADVDFDVTTGVRFHPLEILLSMLWKIGVVLVLGAPAAAVLAFELLLSTTSLFNHGNAAIPARIDRILRWIVVTPDMHRLHHSVLRRETNSNFGFSLPWWDRLLGTYRAQPAAGHDAMSIGIEHLQRVPPAGLGALLTLPFRVDPGRYPINRGREDEG